MRKTLQKNNLPVPNFFSVWNLKEAYEALDTIGYPAVMKPAENMGARGVIKIRKREELPFAYQHSKKYSPTGELILEEFIDGQELSIDILTWNGKFQVTGIADRIIIGEPYFIEIGHNMPSSLPEEIQKEAAKIMIEGMKALGITIGAGKGDIKVSSKGIFIGEIAARLSGGFMSSHTYPLASNVDLYKRAIQIALGEEPDPIIEKFDSVAIERSILCRQGKIISIEGIEKAKELEGVIDVIITKEIGTILQNPTSNIDKIGHIIVKSHNLIQATEIAEKAKNFIQIQIDEMEGINWKQIEENARRKFSNEVCWVCKICDGTNCASSVPGMGGAGNQFSFMDNYRSLQEYKILPSYIHEDIVPDLSFNFFDSILEMPIMIAPITGASTNLKDAITEEELSEFLLKGSLESNTLAWLGDGISFEKYKTIFSVIEKYSGNAVIIFKPREDTHEIIKRIKLAESLNVKAVGIDIDAFLFKTMNLRNQKGKARNIDELKFIRDKTKVPFILKGILSVEDAWKSIQIGADAIVVSNHGGRILDQIPGTARILPDIAKEVKNKILILADGGIRSGIDVFKMMSLGADGVLVGRPFVIAAVGGGTVAIKHLLKQYKNELFQTMKLCGIEKLEKMNRNNLFHLNQSNYQNKKELLI